jgi:Protein of unknown function (DUF3551)
MLNGAPNIPVLSGENCGFSTFEQCQATVSGIGGFCRPSQYNPGYASAGRANKKRKY